MADPCTPLCLARGESLSADSSRSEVASVRQWESSRNDRLVSREAGRRPAISQPQAPTSYHHPKAMLGMCICSGVLGFTSSHSLVHPITPVTITCHMSGCVMTRLHSFAIQLPMHLSDGTSCGVWSGYAGVCYFPILGVTIAVTCRSGV